MDGYFLEVDGRLKGGSMEEEDSIAGYQDVDGGTEITGGCTENTSTGVWKGITSGGRTDKTWTGGETDITSTGGMTDRADVWTDDDEDDGWVMARRKVKLKSPG